MFRLLISITCLFFLVFFALFNRGDVDVVFFPKYLVVSAPSFFWIYTAFALGILVSNIFYSAKFIKSFFRERKMQNKLQKLEKQVDQQGE